MSLKTASFCTACKLSLFCSVLAFSVPASGQVATTEIRGSESQQAERAVDDEAGEDSTSSSARDKSDGAAAAKKPNANLVDAAGATDKGQDDAAENHEFLRIRKNEAGEAVALETAIARYEKKLDNGKTQTVDLIGVVHIGEKEYYEKLNKIFEQYDALLYELVAPEGTRVPKGGRKGETTNPLAALQNGMKSMLELDFQLDHIDYSKENFVHADMSPSEFAESMTKNNESFMSMFMKMLGHSMAMQGKENMPSDAQLLAALFSPDRAMRLRQVFATQFQNIELTMMVFEGDDGSTIINHRNRKALSVMERELAAGKTRLGIFYGAGHLADMHELLTEKYGMQKVSEKWLLAWYLDRDAEAAASAEGDGGTAQAATDESDADEGGSNEVESDEVDAEQAESVEPEHGATNEADREAAEPVTTAESDK